MLGATAKGYARYGWHVLPIMPGDKVPASAHGVRDATTDPDKIEQWWGYNPEFNVGIATGEASGVVVIDVDDLESLRALNEGPNGPLPETATVRTPRGVHLYFQDPDDRDVRNSAGKLGPGIDVRGNGGYVLAPPSRNGDGNEYYWLDRRKPVPLPEWVLEGSDESRPDPFEGAARLGTERLH